MGRQRHAWSDNDTENKIQKHQEELEEEFGKKWQKKIWRLGVEEAIKQLPSLEERLQRVRDDKEILEKKEKKLIAKKRKQNIKSQENRLQAEIRELEEKIEDWSDKEPKTREEIETEYWEKYKQSTYGQKSSSKSKEEYLSQNRVQTRVEGELEKQPSEEKIRSKISSLETKLDAKKEELEELEVQTYGVQ